MTKVEFNQTGTFEASRAAEQWIRARGFSIGPSQVMAPRAIWHGQCYVSKWRGLSAQDKREMHAIMEGDNREGPVTIRLLPSASEAARAAFALTEEELLTAGIKESEADE
jgi:hypothetical protein